MYLFARTWTKKGESRELRALWNYEIRNLLRLNSYPRAQEYFVHLRDLGDDNKRFYVILDAGERVLLSSLLNERGKHRWLQDVSSSQSRRSIWMGITRIATALSILHAEGTIHRSLSPDAVFSDAKGDGDFRLSGFEWSLQVAVPPAVPGKAERRNAARLLAPELSEAAGRYSFATDWFDLGLLAAELFGFSVTGRTKKSLQALRLAIAEHAHLGLSERAALHNLLEADPDQRLAQSGTVLQALASATASVRARELSKGKPLYVGFKLGVGSALSEAIFERTKDSLNIQPADVHGQIDFLKRDLRETPSVTAVAQPYPHYILSGQIFDYRITQWTNRSNAEKTWDAGFCTNLASARLDGSAKPTPLEGRDIAVRTVQQVGDALKRIRSEGVAWTSAFPFEEGFEPLDDKQKAVFEFFQLTNQLDATLAAAQLWPVRVLAVDRIRDRIDLQVTPVSDAKRNLFAQNLGLPATDQQMKDLLTGDPTHYLTEDIEFTLSATGILSRRDEQLPSGNWRYINHRQDPKGIRYYFTQEDVGLQLPLEGEVLFLTPRDLGGTVAQLYRRNQAIDGMRNHAGLLDMIAEPALTRRDTESGVDSKAAAKDLDESKSAALAAILNTQPLYTLQGPPGTGKTKLLASLASGLLAREPAAQILITAHSHEAVRNARRALPKWVREVSDPAERPIIIRLDDDKDDDRVEKRAVQYSQNLAASELAKGTSAHLLARATALASQSSSLASRSFEGLIRKAANIVFATSNSGELARMLDEDRRFDWSIIEEAGKAHGFDLALALQASHRLLLIGDQDQLPPYNFERFENLFREPARILNALKLGTELAPGLIDRQFVNLDESDQAKFRDNCEEWLRMVHFFAELYARAKRSVVRDIPIAEQLKFQHRMQPAIAALVSSCFYNGRLETHPDAIKRFDEEGSPFKIARGSWLPETPLVFVDMPWVQEIKLAVGEKGGDGDPRYTNDDEVEAAIAALAAIHAINGVSCHIQALSPYRAQVKKLAATIADEMHYGGRLENLMAPEFDMAIAQRRGATVDQFQGSEADVVIASLVRNNDEKKGRGLGFLADPRRVNVLVSRARHKLVLIGSRSFLESRIDCSIEPNPEDELAHVARLMRYLRQAERLGTASVVPFSAIKRGGQV
jgi:serine/threonine protein kinase